MTTVVTGAGLIGTAFAQNAIARGEQVVFVDPEPRADFLKLAWPETTVALHDLTGFEGRCDAIYFAKSETPAPPGMATTAWLASTLIALRASPIPVGIAIST